VCVCIFVCVCVLVSVGAFCILYIYNIIFAPHYLLLHLKSFLYLLPTNTHITQPMQLLPHAAVDADARVNRIYSASTLHTASCEL